MNYPSLVVFGLASALSLALASAACSSGDSATTNANGGGSQSDGGNGGSPSGGSATGGGGRASGGSGASSAAGGSAGASGSSGSGGGAPVGSAGAAGASATSFVLNFPTLTLNSDEERTQCVVLDLGNDSAVHIGEIHSRLSGSAYDLVVYKSSAQQAATTASDCAPVSSILSGTDGTPLMLSHRPNDDLILPAGLGFTVAPHQLIRLELHALNSPTPGTANAQATFVVMDGAFQAEAGFLLLKDPDVTVPVMGDATLGPAFFPAAVLSASSIFRVVGYTHRRGLSVKLSLAASASSMNDPLLYSSTDWSNPTVGTFDPPLTIPSGGGIHLTCSWHNDGATAVYNGTAAADEACAALLWYSPTGTAFACEHTDLAGGVDVCCPGQVCP